MRSQYWLLSAAVLSAPGLTGAQEVLPSEGQTSAFVSALMDETGPEGSPLRIVVSELPSYSSPTGVIWPGPNGELAIGCGISGSDGAGEIVVLSSDLGFPESSSSSGMPEFRAPLPSGETSPVVSGTRVLEGGKVELVGTSYGLFKNCDGSDLVLGPISRRWMLDQGGLISEHLAENAALSEARTVTEEGDLAIQHLSIPRVTSEPCGETVSKGRVTVRGVWSLYADFNPSARRQELLGLLRSSQGDLVALGSVDGTPVAEVLDAADGSELYSRELTGSTGTLNAGVAVDDDLVLVGSAQGAGQDSRDMMILKVDPALGVQWIRFCGGPSDDVGTRIALLDDGNLLVGGGTLAAIAPGQPATGQIHDPALLVLDPLGWLIGETIVTPGSAKGEVVGLVQRIGGARMVSSYGGQFDLSLTTEEAMDVDWSQMNDWASATRSGIPGGSGMTPTPGSEIRPDMPPPALTCYDPLVSAKGEALMLANPDEIDMETKLKDRRYSGH